MDFIALRSHLSVKRKITPLRFPTLRSFKLYPVLIVAKKNVKNGKNNLDKKNREKMNSINANNKSCLSKPVEKWKVISIANISHLMIEGTGRVIVTGSPPPRLVHRVVVVLVTIVCLKNRSICRPKN
jgi:hypothetical protein